MLAFPPTYATLIVFCLKANRVTAGVNEHYTQPREGIGAAIIRESENMGTQPVQILGPSSVDF